MNIYICVDKCVFFLIVIVKFVNCENEIFGIIMFFSFILKYCFSCE